jgi:WD40 repeat protein
MNIAFSPDGQILVTEDNNGGVVLWDVSNPSKPTMLSKAITDTAGGNVPIAVFSPNGHLLATASGGDGPVNGPYTSTVTLWNVSDPAHPAALYSQQFSGDYIAALAFKHDGSELAVAPRRGYQNTVWSSVIVWNIDNPAAPTTVSTPFYSYTVGIDALAYRSDGQIVAVADNAANNPQYYFIDLAETSRMVKITCPTSNFSDAMFSANAQTLAISGGSYNSQGNYGTGAVRLYDVTNPARAIIEGNLADSTGWVFAAAFSPDGDFLATGNENSNGSGVARLWILHSPGGV